MNEAHVDRAPASIEVEYELDEAPAKVWRALTDPQLLGAWLMPNDIHAEVGHRFTFRAPPTQEWDGVVYCEVLEVVTHRRLVYAWRGGSHNQYKGGHEVDTVVTWTLTPTAEGGTTLGLVHSGFDPDSFAFKAIGQGWRGKVASRISQILASVA
jgi:uncharacterized protein YndB with AHSA1/START domain